MSRKTVKTDDLIEALVDDRVMQALRSIIKSMFAEQFSEFTSQLKETVESLVNKRVTESLEELVQPFSMKIDDLKKENSELRAQLESTEVYSRLDNLILHGIPESRSESSTAWFPSDGASGRPAAETRSRTQELVTKFCNDKLQIAVTSNDISIAHRLPRGKTDKFRPIIVRFTSRRIREDVYGARKNLRTLYSGNDDEGPIFVNEHLTKTNAQIFAGTRQLLKKKKIHGTWTYGGNIFVRKSATIGEKPLRIETLEELHKLQASMP